MTTHLSLHYHIVFSTKHREPSIAASWRPRLHAFLGGAVREAGDWRNAWAEQPIMSIS
jgi:hypothetical protein